MITKLYERYFQKSRSFLFPALGIPKTVHPLIQTYIGLNDVIKPEDNKLICLFHHASTHSYERFEQEYLFRNPLFHDCEVVRDEPSIYIFNLEVLKQDWDKFLKGKYSQLSDGLKDAIKDYYGSKSGEYEYVDTYLYPDRYYKLYATLLNESEETLKSVGELCDIYDPEKERLLFSTEKFGKLENNSLHL